MPSLSSVQNAAILQGLEQAHLDQLAEIASEREIHEGEQLFTRGEQAVTFYIAKRGHFALTLPVRTLDEQDEFVVEEKGALDAFGWSSLVEPQTSIYSAYCTSEGAAVTFSGEELRQLIRHNDGLGQRLSSNLNVLIGARVRAVQDLWVEELEHSCARVNYWTHSEMSNRLQRSMKKQFARGSMWQRLTRGLQPPHPH